MSKSPKPGTTNDDQRSILPTVGFRRTVPPCLYRHGQSWSHVYTRVGHLFRGTPSTPLVVRNPGTCHGLVNPGAPRLTLDVAHPLATGTPDDAPTPRTGAPRALQPLRIQ